MKKPVQKSKKTRDKGKKKVILTPRFSTGVGKSKGKPKKKVLAIAAKPEFYRVELEVASKAGDGTTQYTYSAIAQKFEMTEEAAQEQVGEMKAMGIGGRLIHLDGTPEGKIINTWGSVERTAEAEKVERAALEGAGQN